MSPVPISPSVVHVVLQYIVPPSQLTQPLPPHLLSKSLLQRHHFLQLSHDDPHEYLCWPMSAHSQGSAVDFLENMHPPSEDDPPSYVVRYTSDEEHTYAHVALKPHGDGIRLVFEWDEDSGWKYHDAAMLPFPSGSRATVVREEKQYPRPAQPILDLDSSHLEQGGDENYWDAYEAQEDDVGSLGASPVSPMAGMDTIAEDAYWARYTLVHGTADSTRPSPGQRRHLILQAVDGDWPEFPLWRAPSVPYQAAQGAFPMTWHHDQGSRWDPASPRALAQRLAAIPVIPSPAASPEPTFPEDGRAVDALHILEDRPRGRQMEVPVKSGRGEGDTLPLHMEPQSSQQLVGRQDASEVEALKEGLQGLWKLWKARRQRPEPPQYEDDRDIFLRVVHDVISSSSG